MTNRFITSLVAAGALLVLFAVPASLACSCATPPPKWAFKASRAVFVGTVLSGDGLNTTAELRVTEAFKGVRAGAVVRIDSPGMCGVLFRVGQTYLVQIYYRCSEAGQPETDNTSFYASYCSYTHTVDAPGWSKALHAFRKYAAWWRSPISGRDRRCP